VEWTGAGNARTFSSGGRPINYPEVMAGPAADAGAPGLPLVPTDPYLRTSASPSGFRGPSPASHRFDHTHPRPREVPSMPDSNLLVPGTGGITLIDSDGNDVGWPVLMRIKGIIRGVQGKDDDELVELMGMEHRPGQLAPTKTSLKPDVALHPGHVLRVAYNQVQDGFVDFLYDWRADLRHSARQLLDFIRERRPEDGRWNLVGHSQGGLLIILASKLMDAEDDFSELVRTATLVGPPVAGTMKAAAAMIVGDNAGERLAPVMRRTIRMWPAIYQMLPAWPAVVDDRGEPVADDLQLTRQAGWPGLDGVQDDLLLRARRAQELLKDPLSHMEGVDARFYWAENRKTPATIRRPDGGPLEWDIVESVKGDSLVPFSTTIEWIGPEIGPHVTAFQPPCEAHAYMLNDDTVVTHLKERIA